MHSIGAGINIEALQASSSLLLLLAHIVVCFTVYCNHACLTLYGHIQYLHAFFTVKQDNFITFILLFTAHG